MIMLKRALERLRLASPSGKPGKTGREIRFFIEPREGDRYMRCDERWFYIGHDEPELKEVEACNLPRLLLAIDISPQPENGLDTEEAGTQDDDEDDSCSCIPRGNKIYSVTWRVCGPDPSRPSLAGALEDRPREYVLRRWGLVTRKAQPECGGERTFDLVQSVEIDAMAVLFRDLDRLQAVVDGRRTISDGYRGDMTITYTSGKEVTLDRETTSGDRTAFGRVWEFLARECPELMGEGV